MSRLRVYWPDATSDVDDARAFEEAIVQFPGVATANSFSESSVRPQLPSRSNRHPATTLRGPHYFTGNFGSDRAAASTLNVVDRARTLYANRCCPTCTYPIVEPVELDDAMVNRNGQPIPGTATLIGFRCDACDSEWPASHND